MNMDSPEREPLLDFDLGELDRQAEEQELEYELTPNRAWRRNFVNTSQRYRQERRFARAVMARLNPPAMVCPKGV